MVSTILSILGTEAAVSTASTLAGATLVRVYNNNGSDVLLTLTKADATTQTVTIRTGAVEFIKKAPATTITAATSCRMVQVEF